VSGKDYTRSITQSIFWSDRPQSAGYDIGRGYREFRATAGIQDDSPSGSTAKFQIYGDGRLLYDKTLTLGDSDEVSVDITGVLRLQLWVTPIQNSTFTGVWGDARLLGAQGEVPTPAAGDTE
jgi:hypothetical protein